MEKTTRVQKYKELRDSMKEEVSIERNKMTNDEEGVDDFLSFLKEEEEENNDTLKNPLSYETLDDDSSEVKEALNQAKVNVGKNQYNTRLDILNKIKNEEKKEEAVEEDLSSGHVVNGNQKKMSLLEKLAAMSDEEEVEENEDFEIEEDVKIYDKHETAKVEEKKEIKEESSEIVEEDEEKGDKLLTVLNVIIIVLIIAFLALIGLFVKQLLF